MMTARRHAAPRNTTRKAIPEICFGDSFRFFTLHPFPFSRCGFLRLTSRIPSFTVAAHLKRVHVGSPSLCNDEFLLQCVNHNGIVVRSGYGASPLKPPAHALGPQRGGSETGAQAGRRWRHPEKKPRWTGASARIDRRITVRWWRAP